MNETTLVVLETIEGDKLYINPLMVGAVGPLRKATQAVAPNRCVVNVFGVQYRIATSIQSALALIFGVRDSSSKAAQPVKKGPQDDI